MSQGRARHYYHFYKDWIYGASIILGIAAIVAGVYLYNRHSTYIEPKISHKSQTYDFYDNELYKIVPPDPQYPAPAKTQLAFYRSYDAETLSFSLEWTERNLHRDVSIGDHKFTLNLENHLNSDQAVTGDLLRHVSVGCVAYDNPYHTVSAPIMKPFTLSAYERRQITFNMSITCMYLGTTDGTYFWRIY
jgi:hypothetical protein